MLEKWPLLQTLNATKVFTVKLLIVQHGCEPLFKTINSNQNVDQNLACIYPDNEK